MATSSTGEMTPDCAVVLWLMYGRHLCSDLVGPPSYVVPSVPLLIGHRCLTAQYVHEACPRS